MTTELSDQAAWVGGGADGMMRGSCSGIDAQNLLEKIKLMSIKFTKRSPPTYAESHVAMYSNAEVGVVETKPMPACTVEES